MAEHKATRRLHLITNPKRPDLFMAMAGATDREPSPVVEQRLGDSVHRHPSNVEAS